MDGWQVVDSKFSEASKTFVQQSDLISRLVR